jgi:hypothetical protein
VNETCASILRRISLKKERQFPESFEPSHTAICAQRPCDNIKAQTPVAEETANDIKLRPSSEFHRLLEELADGLEIRVNYSATAVWRRRFHPQRNTHPK